MPPILCGTTGNQRVDQGLEAAIGLCEMVFPGQIRSYYLIGSYAKGSAIAVSDIDFEVIFATKPDEKTRARADELSEYCNRLDPPCGFSVRVEAELTTIGRVALKTGSLLLYGHDIRPDMPMPPLEEYVRAVMPQGPSFSRERLRGRIPRLHYPLDLPDSDDPFGGYFNTGRTKDLIQAVFWAISGLVALRTGTYVIDRRHALDTYRKEINDEWTGFIEELFELGRNQLQYRIPQEADDRQHFADLCHRTLEFENYFLDLFRGFVLDQLQSRQPQKVTWAIDQFELYWYPEEPVRAALDAEGEYWREQGPNDGGNAARIAALLASEER
jgi:predicted nucleotidyltransferase